MLEKYNVCRISPLPWGAHDSHTVLWIGRSELSSHHRRVSSAAIIPRQGSLHYFVHCEHSIVSNCLIFVKTAALPAISYCARTMLIDAIVMALEYDISKVGFR